MKTKRRDLTKQVRVTLAAGATGSRYSMRIQVSVRPNKENPM